MKPKFDKLLGEVRESDKLEVMNSESSILSSSPDEGRIVLDGSTGFLYIGTGSKWLKLPFRAIEEKQNPDIGWAQNSSRIGYGEDYITDKTLNYVKIGGGANNEEGAIRIVNGTYQVYLNGRWNDIVLGFRFREDETGSFEFEHQPIGFTEWIEIFSGNSESKGLNGRPIIQQYTASMGAYPPALQIDGGEF